MRASRHHPAYWAFLGHRLSGLALGVFLPIHFYVLGMALEDANRFDQFIRLADMKAFKMGEWGLVILLSTHMCFGLRLLALELLNWRSVRDARLSWITGGILISMVFGLLFAFGVMG
jgi:fumarate reductase subunit D